MFFDAPVALRVIVLLLSQASPDASPDPARVEFDSAMRKVVGPDTLLDVRDVASLPSDQDALALAAGTAGIAQATWSADRSQVTLHIYVHAQKAWLDRTITFNPEDGELDKERHLGFALGSMFAGALASGRLAEAAPANTASGTASPLSTRGPTARNPSGSSLNAEPRGTSINPATPHDSSARASGWHFAALASGGIGGGGGGVGAALGWHEGAWQGAWWRLTIGAQAGEVPQAQATTKTLRAALGLDWNLLPQNQPVELGLRVDLGAQWLQVAHLSADDAAADREHRWNSGAALLGWFGVRLSDSSAIVAAAGIEMLAGKTELETHGRLVATIVPYHWLSEVGVRVDY